MRLPPPDHLCLSAICLPWRLPEPVVGHEGYLLLWVLSAVSKRRATNLDGDEAQRRGVARKSCRPTSAILTSARRHPCRRRDVDGFTLEDGSDFSTLDRGLAPERHHARTARLAIGSLAQPVRSQGHRGPSRTGPRTGLTSGGRARELSDRWRDRHAESARSRGATLGVGGARAPRAA